MREALAGANHDVLLRDEKRSGAQKRGGRGKAKKSLWVRLFGGRRRALLLVGFAALAAIGIPLNALYLQEGRHPAPLFRASAPEARVEPKTAHVPAAPAPLPPSRPLAQAQDAPAPAAKPAATKPEPVRAEKRDAIGALLDGGGHKSEAAADKRVLAAQRALAKLGYAVRADGVFGGSTRQALEKFERDSGLPVKGELTAKIKRQLHARSGLPVE